MVTSALEPSNLNDIETFLENSHLAVDVVFWPEVYTPSSTPAINNVEMGKEIAENLIVVNEEGKKEKFSQNSCNGAFDRTSQAAQKLVSDLNCLAT